MTAFVRPEDFPSKAVLKENLDGGEVRIYTPAPWGTAHRLSGMCEVGTEVLVTNHPKRTKFAKLLKTQDGWKVS